MELMRHNDPRLTAKTYPDASLLPLRNAVEKLVYPASQIASQISGAKGQSEASPVAKVASVNGDKTIVNKGGLSLYDAACLVLTNVQMVRDTGFEPVESRDFIR